VQSFSNGREAKEFLAERIVSQAHRDGVSLTETERKMLYFSETYWTLPDMAEVSAEFDRDYDQDEYERKIAGLVRAIQQALIEDEEADRSWENAVRVLREEDHYLVVLINGANKAEVKAGRPAGYFLKLMLTALLVVAVAFVVVWFFEGRR
jgi:hypothetical protein